MIDFRYHLVSLVAVFLALAVGIVLGTTALNGPLTRGLQSTEAKLRSTADNLRAQNNQQASRLSGDASLVTAAAPRLLGGLLPGEQVVLVTAPGADGAVVAGLTTAIHQAGATVTGQVGLNQQFFDTSATTESSLTALAQQLAPAGTVTTAGATQQGDDPQLSGQSEASAVLAAALLAQETGHGPARPDPVHPGGLRPAGLPAGHPGHDQRGHDGRGRRPRRAARVRRRQPGQYRAALADREAERRRARYGAGRLIPGRIRAWQRHRRADQRRYRNSGVQRG